MAGLVGYESSDEEDAPQEETQQKAQPVAEEGKHATRIAVDTRQSPDKPRPTPPSTAPKSNKKSATEKSEARRPIQNLPSLRPVMGPTLGPTPSFTSATPAGPQRPPLPEPDSEPDPNGPHRSPTSAARTMLRDLTLPAVPNMDIPPSPPRSGSPPAGQSPGRLDALSSKLDNFLDMKRRKGVHFNARLAGNAHLRNPALMDKLLVFAGVETSSSTAATDDAAVNTAAVAGPAGEYATTLPAKVWDPSALPTWASRTPLRRAQEKMQMQRERAKGEAVEFVSAGGPSSSSSRGGTPGAGGAGTGAGSGVAPVTGKRKSRFDT